RIRKCPGRTTQIRPGMNNLTKNPVPDTVNPAGSLGLPHLEHLWNRARLSGQGNASPVSAMEIMRDNVTLAGLGLAVEETMEHLFHAKPDFPAFEQWVLAINGGMIAPERIERIKAAISGAGPTA